MVIAITGASGFIGSKVTHALLNDGHTIIGIDNRESNTIHERYSHYIADICSETEIERIFKDNSIECLIHFAALVHKRGSEATEEAFNRINYEASKNIFDLAAKYDIKKILFSSTIEVYGEVDKQIVTVDEPCHPKTFYGKSKLMAEKALLEHKNDYELVIMRFAPVYSDDFLLNIRKRIVLKGKIGYYFKKGEYSFCLCSIETIIETIRNLISIEDIDYHVIHVNDGRNITAKELLEYLKELDTISFAIRMPYKLFYFMIIIIDRISKLFSKKERFLSVHNFNKLFKSTEYSLSGKQ